jgi:hypothetical protein
MDTRRKYEKSEEEEEEEEEEQEEKKKKKRKLPKPRNYKSHRQVIFFVRGSNNSPRRFILRLQTLFCIDRLVV